MPFRAIRPLPEYAKDIAALPYDVMNAAEARAMTTGNPLSFLHIDKAEIDLPPNTNPYSEKVYETAAANLRALASGELPNQTSSDNKQDNSVKKSGAHEPYIAQDSSPSYYLYRLTMDGRSQAGVVACPAADDYITGSIKKHELTRAAKEEDRVRHITALNANTGPIFLMHRTHDELAKIKRDIIASRTPIYDFTKDDDVRHEVWVIDEPDIIAKIKTAFGGIESLYIADGHHRCASAIRVAQQKRAANPNYTGDEEFNYFLAVIFDADELEILDYNRVIRDLNGLTPREFLAAADANFAVEIRGVTGQPYKPRAPHEFGVYLDNAWYKLTAKPELIAKIAGDPLKNLDVAILQDYILAPILGIGDPRTDERIDFVGGIRGLSELERRAGSGGDMKIAFALYPTSTEELMNIADAGLIMPPKSTWFEPKLLSGLFIHSLE
jgi:uncharacterized protein (DUF1015 family)